MKINRITIKGASGYCCVDEAYEDKISITSSSISYEYKPHPDSNLETNIYRKWSYKTNSPVFEQLFKKLAEKTPNILNCDEKLLATDIGPVQIIVSFEDKHRKSANYFCPSEFFADYFRLIKQMVPSTEYIPVTLLTQEDFKDEDVVFKKNDLLR